MKTHIILPLSALALACHIQLGWSQPACTAGALCSLKVLIAEDELDLQSDPNIAEKIRKLAPNLEQIHLRIKSQYTNAGQQLALMQKIQAQYDYPLTFGFHPDNSNSSYSEWGCTNQDNICVFQNSVKKMNEMNAQATAQAAPLFTIFSTEQSYLEPSTQQGVQTVKACLQGKNSGTNTYCPEPEDTANPTVKYGYVAPSCGGPTFYNADNYDYGYPQMYNLTHNWTYTSGNTSLPSSIFVNPGQSPAYPASGTTYLLLDAYNSVDAWKFKKPALPVGLAHQGYNTIYQANMLNKSGHVEPALAAQVLATLMTTKFGSTVAPFPCGPTGDQIAKRYFTLSGEGQFLGAPGWSAANLNTFFSELDKQLKAKGVSTTETEYAIWSFDTMLHNIEIDS